MAKSITQLEYEVEQLEANSEALEEENEELERRIEALETILVALCKNAQTPLHITKKEYDEAGDLILDIEDDEGGGMLISAKSAVAKMNKFIDQIANNLKEDI